MTPVDLVAGEYDAAVQLGEFIQRDMIAVRVTKEMRLAVVGSPAYLESNSDHSLALSLLLVSDGIGKRS